MTWYRVDFQLEDFGHHNAQLISKNYFTYPFFTPTQVDYAFTYREDLLTHPDYAEEEPLSTPANPIGQPRIIQRLYTIRNSPVGKLRKFKFEPIEQGKYPTFGKSQYIAPGTKFYAYSQNKPKTDVIMIGKKRRVARILRIEEVSIIEEHFKLTSPDLINHEHFRALNLFEYQILAMSARWVYGLFKVEKVLKIGDDYFISPIIEEIINAH
jgi:hypothetical protein